jgi:hypothetical protein
MSHGEKSLFLLANHTLEALAMDDGRTALVILLLGDPHLLEGREGGEDGTTDPDRVLALWRGDDLDLHRGRSEGGDLLLHAVGDTWVHSGTTGLSSLLARIYK